MRRSHINVFQFVSIARMFTVSDIGIKEWNKQATLSRTFQSITSWVVFRNGNWLKAEIATLRTRINHPKSTDFCLLSSNKKASISIFLRKEPDCRH